MRSHNQKFDMLIRGIVMTRKENGATIEEMRSDYFHMFGEHWPLKNSDLKETISYLVEIDGLMMEEHETGLCIWYIDDIGSTLSTRGSFSTRHVDSNNNGNVTTQPDRDSSNELVSSSSFVGGNTVPPSMVSSSSSSTMSAAATLSPSSVKIDSIQPNENACGPSVTVKRKLSTGICSQEEKRTKSSATDRLPLIEKNLNIHNWNSGANAIVKQQVTTSTEKESSILILNGAANAVGIDAIEGIDLIEIVGESEWQSNNGAELNKLQK